MEKYYCDICGKECGATKFIVPNIIKRTFDGNKNVVDMNIISDMNICNNCQNLIGCFIYGLSKNKE